MKKLTAFLLALLMLLLPLVSCGPEDDEKTDDSGAADTSAPATDGETVNEEEKLEIPNEKFEGENFHILTATVEGFNYSRVDFDEPSDNAYDNAIYERNLAVENLLGITISESDAEIHDGVYNTFKTSTFSNTGDYDITFMKYHKACPAVAEGLCTAIDQLQYIDLDKAWWNDDTTEQLALMNRPYMIAGDIALSDKECTWCVSFQKDIITQHGLENPYNLVLSNEWTWDKMVEMAEVAYSDINADGNMDPLTDMWGFITERENYPAMWVSAGLTMAELDEDGYPVITWGSEQFMNVYQEMVEFFESEFSLVDWNYTGWNGKAKRENRVLFSTLVVGSIQALRDNEYDFGIVPYPKYNKDIERYNTFMTGNSFVMIVGNDNQDLYMTSIVTEAMAAYGREILTPAYYEGQLKSRFARDEIMPQMLDLIFTNRMYDIGTAFDWGYYTIQAENVEIASTWAKSERVIQRQLDKINKQMADLE